ncbi:MAG TPA: hypothetical protein VK859_12610 [bacterium]|jgi:hypothetical protein|nr:hypothetical protein [bacterium]
MPPKANRPNEQQLSEENQMKMMAVEHNAKYGILSYLWGSGLNAASNIAGLVAILLILVVGALSISFLNNFENLKSFWGMILPVLGTILGFLFGQNKKSND